jgi:hypothetical protein
MQSSHEIRRLIDSLKAKQQKDRRCPICLESYSRSEGVLPCTIPCGHTLCKNCLGNFIRQRRECAYCRKSIPIKEAVPSYEFLTVLEDREKEISSYNAVLDRIIAEADMNLKQAEEEMMRKLSLESEKHEMDMERLRLKAQEVMNRNEFELQRKLEREREMHLEMLIQQKEEEMKQAIEELKRKTNEEKLQELARKQQQRLEMRVRKGIIKLDDPSQLKSYRKKVNHPGVIWAWEGPKGWVLFDKDRNDVIEKSFHQGLSSCTVNYKGMEFYIDLINWLSKKRPNDRNPSKIKRINNVPGPAKWYLSKELCLNALSPQANFDIEFAWQNNEAQVTVKENSEAYVCDLETLRCVYNEISYNLIRLSTVE